MVEDKGDRTPSGVRSETPIRFGIEQGWYGEKVLAKLGLEAVRSPRELASVGAALTTAYDQYRSVMDASSVSEATANLLGSGTSMVDVPRLVGEPLDVVVSALFCTGAPLTWSELDWLEVEAVLYDEAATMTENQLAVRLGVHRYCAAHLCELYGVTANADALERLEAINGFIRDGLSPRAVAEATEAAGFAPVTENMVYKMRAKLRREDAMETAARVGGGHSERVAS